MSLIVEDGSIVAGAESYVSVADCTTYWSNRNDTIWSAASTAAKEAALRQATAYMDATYNFSGVLSNSAQMLMWPRILPYGMDSEGRAISNSTIPVSVKSACCELAWEAVQGALLVSADRGGMVKSEKVGSLQIEYMDAAPAGKLFPVVDILLRRLAVNGGNEISGTVLRS